MFATSSSDKSQKTELERLGHVSHFGNSTFFFLMIGNAFCLQPE